MQMSKDLPMSKAKDGTSSLARAGWSFGIRSFSNMGKFVIGHSWAVIFATCTFAELSRPTLPPEERTNGRLTLTSVAKLKPFTVACAARIESLLGRVLCTATVVGEDGYVLLKASEVPDLAKTRIHFSDGRKADLREVHRDVRLDLLLAQAVGVTGLRAAAFETAKHLTSGQWLCSVAAAGKEERIGVVSAKARRILGTGAAMGIRMDEKASKGGKGVRIIEIASDSPAEEAGLEEDDVILSIAGEAVNQFRRVHDLVNQRQPGEVIALTYRREGREAVCRVRLASRTQVLKNWEGEDFANGGVSLRNDNFPQVLQHDTPLHPSDMGGPIATLEGRVVGINIARVDRVTTFALPVEVFWTEVQRRIKADRHPPKAIVVE